MVLIGASGTGKSRIVREVYRVLQQRESNPPYWPEIEEHHYPHGFGAGADPMPGRKILGPPLTDFIWPSGALPSFGWWMLDCDRMPRGDLLDVVAQAGPALQAHLTPVRLAWREAAGWPEKLSASRASAILRIREAASEGGLEAADEVLNSLDLAIPGLGLGLKWINVGLSKLKHDLLDKRMLDAESRLIDQVRSTKESAAVELARIITAVTHPKLPAVVVVEDLPLMGADLADFINLVTQRQPSHPVLCSSAQHGPKEPPTQPMVTGLDGLKLRALSSQLKCHSSVGKT
jgi:hypothetical protein